MVSIKRAAELTGVSEYTLRAWERRLGAFQPARRASGYRDYDEATLERVILMRDLVAGGMAPRDAAAEVERRAKLAHGPVDGLTERLLVALEAIDAEQVDRILDEAFGRARFETVVGGWLMPALDAVGEAWATGRISVAAEHLVSAAVGRRLSMVFEAAGAGHGRPLVCGLPARSHHELGLLAFGAAVRRRGVPAVYLGPDVPLQSWLDAVGSVDAWAAVTVAVQRRDVAPIDALAEALPAGVALFVGGGYQDLTAPRATKLGHDIPQAALQLAGSSRPPSAGSVA